MADKYDFVQGVQIVDALQAFVEKGDFRDAFEQCKGHIEENFWQIFQSAVDSEGNPWPEHAESTVAKMGEHELLVDTGALLQSMTDQGNYTISDRYMVASCDLEYAEYQNFGTSNIPPREFMYLRPETIDKVMETIYAYVLLKYGEMK